MKKSMAMLLTLAVLVCLAACETEPAQTSQPTEAAQVTTQATTAPQDTEPAVEEVFSFPVGNVELVPGAAFNAAVLPEPVSIYQVPSCAFEGTDNVYDYGTAEVTVFDDGKQPIIYSIYLVGANTTTPEGLYLGDPAAQVDKLYGAERTENGTELVYQKGETLLIIILDNGTVASIEYRSAIG